MTTSNGLSPHLFPEYITACQYYYGGAPRPGMMGRFLVAESGTRAPYWPTTQQNSGGQINASSNGDMPGDIYRLIGGVVLRAPDRQPDYAGYLASAFLLPPGSNNNRVIAAGSENLQGPYHQQGRVFLVGTRPGMTYDTGTLFGPAVQIDPVLPANLSFTLDFPDGRRVSTSGTGDSTGSWVGEKWTLDQPGIYRFHLSGDWQGFPATMPGPPPDGGLLYVIEKDRPAGAAGIDIKLPVTSTFDPGQVLTFSGTSTADTISYAAIMPGSVLDEGTLAVHNGTFNFTWDPKLMNERSQTYDTVSRATGKPSIGDVVHLTFFSVEKASDGTRYHAFARVVLRGNQVIWTK